MATRVFISYAQESDAHREAVRELWVYLRENGIDAKFDQAAAETRQDWALWMGDQVRAADVVLCVASEQYRKRAEGRESPEVGRGVQWEARLIRDAFHAAQDNLTRFVPVVVKGQTRDGVPDFLAPSTTTVYHVDTPQGADRLLRFLLDRPAIVEPPLGPPRLEYDAYSPDLAAAIDGSPVGTVTDVVVWLPHDATTAKPPRLADGRLLAAIPGVRVSHRLRGIERPATPPLPGPLKVLTTDLESDLPVQVRVLEVPSLDEITHALRADQFHVVQLSGQASPEGVELADEDGTPVFVPARQLVDALRSGERPLPLIVVTSVDLAVTLIRLGADRVVATTNPALDLYEALSNGATTAQALRDEQAILLRCGADLPLVDPSLPAEPLSHITLPSTGIGVRELPIGRLIGRRDVARTAMAVIRGTDRDQYGDLAGVVITGVGGIGKTAVAGRILARAREHGWRIVVHEGAWNPTRLITEIAGPNGDLDAVCEHLRTSRLVVLFDDFEQNLTPDGQFRDNGFAALFGQLCQAAHAATILVTSRYPFPNEDLLHRIDLPPLTPVEQARLYLRLPALRDLSAEDRRTVTYTLGGHPRLIEFLDVLLRQRADLRHITAKLRALAKEEGLDPKATRDLTSGITDAIRLGSRDILLSALLTHLTEAQADLALQLSLYRASTTRADLAFTHESPTLDVDIARLRDLTLISTTGDEHLMHAWVAQSIRLHLTPKQREVRQSSGFAMRSARVEAGTARVEDKIEIVRHLANLGWYGVAETLAVRFTQELPGHLVARAAFLAEVVPLFPVTAVEGVRMLSLECIVARACGMVSADKVQRTHDAALRLATAHPDEETLWLLVTAHDLLGQEAQANFAHGIAYSHYTEALRITQELADALPERLDFRRGVVAGHLRLGAIVFGPDHAETRAEHLAAAVDAAEALHDLNPDDPGAVRGLLVVYSAVGDFLLEQDEVEEAGEFYATCLRCADLLTGPEALHDRVVVHRKLSGLAASQGDKRIAGHHLGEAARHMEKLLALDPENVQYAKSLVELHTALLDTET
ncbi:tetratricopeptide (TPR) repeat protein [Actinokineospora baliensis]|uniref:toll/interleukin-1 receptor domain-containing protein n=1 Tax=Actinokineospora baliensis TaxID=547056 RepID=UPI00195B3607|nr:toll/interleukin-1 receptor domain-containing protein [Actinokineospora baliensis]MBM7773672.1 tetratricopeptide (TPR) repeat protein [Actinokineospora baliensis]